MRKLAFLFVAVLFVVIAGCSDDAGTGAPTAKAGSEAAATPEEGSGDSAENQGAEGSTKSSYVVDYSKDTCNGPDHDSDDDPLYVEIADNAVMQIDITDDVEEEVVSYEDNVISFIVVDSSEDGEKVTSECEIKLEGDKATGGCTNGKNQCALYYTKCNDTLEVTKECICKSLQTAANFGKVEGDNEMCPPPVEVTKPAEQSEPLPIKE